MTYVVNENCIKCKYMDCIEVCPVDCFYEGDNMLVIHPDECIDCGVCEPECPADAIKPDTEPGLEKWLSLNARICGEMAEYHVQEAAAARWQGVRGRCPTSLRSTFRRSPAKATKAEPVHYDVVNPVSVLRRAPGRFAPYTEKSVFKFR